MHDDNYDMAPNQAEESDSKSEHCRPELADEQRRALVEKALKVGLGSSLMVTIFSAKSASASSHFPPPPPPPPPSGPS